MTDGDPTDRRYTYLALQSDGLPFSKHYVDATSCRQNNAIPDSARPTTVFLGQNNVQVLFWLRVYNTFFMLNSAEHEFFFARKC